MPYCSDRYDPLTCPLFLNQGKQCDEAMRTVTFTLAERAVLIPVELFLLAKPLLAVCVLVFLLSGIGPSFFSPAAALERGLILLGGTVLGIFGGAVLDASAAALAARPPVLAERPVRLPTRCLLRLVAVCTPACSG